MTRTALILACALAMSAVHAKSGERERQIFRALDENRDGTISAAEARWGRRVIEAFAPATASGGGSAPAKRSPFFARWDRNDDGYLTERELWEANVPRGAGWMASDANGDGRISRPEFTPVPPPP
jgi:Ca2+-binding EF-hand superfamily protein